MVVDKICNSAFTCGASTAAHRVIQRHAASRRVRWLPGHLRNRAHQEGGVLCAWSTTVLCIARSAPQHVEHRSTQANRSAIQDWGIRRGQTTRRAPCTSPGACSAVTRSIPCVAFHGAGNVLAQIGYESGDPPCADPVLRLRSVRRQFD